MKMIWTSKSRIWSISHHTAKDQRLKIWRKMSGHMYTSLNERLLSAKEPTTLIVWSMLNCKFLKLSLAKRKRWNNRMMRKMMMTTMTMMKTTAKSKKKNKTGQSKTSRACLWLPTWSLNVSVITRISASLWNQLRALEKSISLVSSRYMKLSKCSSYRMDTFW